MKYIAAYALLVLGGKAEPTVQQVEQVLKEAGVKADVDHVTKLVNAVKGKKLHELIAEGTKKMSASAPAAAPSGGDKADKGGKKVVEKEEPKVEEAADVDMGNMFGDEY